MVQEILIAVSVPLVVVVVFASYIYNKNIEEIEGTASEIEKESKSVRGQKTEKTLIERIEKLNEYEKFGCAVCAVAADNSEYNIAYIDFSNVETGVAAPDWVVEEKSKKAEKELVEASGTGVVRTDLGGDKVAMIGDSSDVPKACDYQ